MCPFFTRCEAMEFAETGNRREEGLDQLQSILMVLHALRLEYEKTTEMTAYSHRSCLVWSSRESRAEAALAWSVPLGLGGRDDIGYLCPNMAQVLATATRDKLLSRILTGCCIVPVMASRFLLVRRWEIRSGFSC